VNEIVDFYGRDIVGLSVLCRVNKDISCALGHSATAMLTRARHIDWNVPEMKSHNLNPLANLIGKNKNVESLTMSSPARVLVGSIDRTTSCSNTLEVLRLRTHDSYINEGNRTTLESAHVID